MAKSQDAFRTISEVADWLETPAHVLRFWESRFTQVKPVKRAGGRRYYRPADMELLSGIKKLLHEDGMTIKGVQKLLRAEGIKHVAAMSQSLGELAPADDPKAQKPLSDALKIGTPIKDDALEGQVISFPQVDETASEEETAPAISEHPSALEPEAPLQASFLDDVSETPEETPETPTPILEPPQPSNSVPEMAETLPSELIDAEPEVTPLVTETEETPQEAPTDPALSTEMSAPTAEIISTDTPLRDEPIESDELQEAETDESETSETPELVAEKVQPDAEITSVAELVLPDASEVPEVGNTVPSTPPEAPEIPHSGDTDRREDVALEEDVTTSANIVENIAQSAVESSVHEEEPDAENTPEEASLEQTSEPEMLAPDDTPHIEELAPDEPLTTAPPDALNPISDPEPHFGEASEDPEPVFQSNADPESATTPDALESEDIPASELEPEGFPAEEAIPLPCEALDDPEDDNSTVAASTIRENIWRRAAPFSPDKKSELAEVTARLVALRKSYGNVSKPSPEN